MFSEHISLVEDLLADTISSFDVVGCNIFE